MRNRLDILHAINDCNQCRQLKCARYITDISGDIYCNALLLISLVKTQFESKIDNGNSRIKKTHEDWALNIAGSFQSAKTRFYW